MAKRKQRSKKDRFELFKRDSFTCQYCGAHPPAVVLVLDHIVPVAEGGLSDDDNLVTACEPCNQGKSARNLSQIPQSLADKATATAEAEAQLRGFHGVMEDRRARIESDAWEVADIFVEHFHKDGIRKDWFRSIRNFNEKLGKYEVIDAMESSCDRAFGEYQTFLYFCAICWRKVKDETNA